MRKYLFWIFSFAWMLAFQPLFAGQVHQVPSQNEVESTSKTEENIVWQYSFGKVAMLFNVSDA